LFTVKLELNGSFLRIANDKGGERNSPRTA